MERVHIGIDVQMSRGCPYFVIDDESAQVESGWLTGDIEQRCKQLRMLYFSFKQRSSEMTLGIDAPRSPLNSPRRWSWKKRKWVELPLHQTQVGRHCELIIKAYNLANPQWTPLASSAKKWMQLGFALYNAVEGLCTPLEVFPSASYTLLNTNTTDFVRMNFSNFKTGPKDMLDACVAAVTVREFIHGRGCEVGGGDGLGTIILPTPLPPGGPERVLTWP